LLTPGSSDPPPIPVRILPASSLWYISIPVPALLPGRFLLFYHITVPNAIVFLQNNAARPFAAWIRNGF